MRVIVVYIEYKSFHNVERIDETLKKETDFLFEWLGPSAIQRL